MSSTWCAIPSGVRQGSLLGRLFFVIFISDLHEVVIPGNCLSLYADDYKTSRIINCPADHSVFQSDLNNLYSYSQQNLTEFNVKKYKLTQITKRKTIIHSDLHLNNNILELTSNQLQCVLDTHNDRISNKANKILGLINRGHKRMFFFFFKLSFPIVLIILLSTIIGALRAEPLFAFFSEEIKGGSNRIALSL